MHGCWTRRRDSTATYEIHLHGTPPEALVAEFAPGGVRRLRPQTMLMCRITSQEELALVLLDRVFTMGLVLNDVHEARASSPAISSRAVSGQRSVHRAYEVRVDGELMQRCCATWAGSTDSFQSRPRCAWRALPSASTSS